jgi:succinate-semialdehyde dehydrogenase/glutarate-semialdehyde dehydrogenase
MAIATVSPVTGEILKSFDELTPEELEDKLARAGAAADSYRLTTVEQRAGWLAHAADNLEKEADSVSNLITAEMGKTYRAAQDEVAKCIRGLRFYAAEAPGFLQNLAGDARSVGAKQTYVSYQPIGVVLAVMPVESAAVVGHAFCGARPDGRQCRRPQACLQPAPDRAVHGTALP